MIIVDHDRINNDPTIKAQEREHCRNPTGENLTKQGKISSNESHSSRIQMQTQPLDHRENLHKEGEESCPLMYTSDKPGLSDMGVTREGPLED
jgi:hypothetical protein